MRGRRLRGDDGVATTEFVIAAPAFLFMLMLIVQAGLWFHAISVASAAAQDGARAASLQGADVGLGKTVAEDFCADLAPNLLSGVDATASEAGGVVRVTVSAQVVAVFALPGVDLNLPVHETAERTREIFRPAGTPPPAR
jgi:Flp pilus assembly protein TadG